MPNLSKLNEKSLKARVQAIYFPTVQDYYQLTSADGYALLGAAKFLLGLEYQKEEEIVFNGDVLGLRDSYAIQGEKFDRDTEYIYTCWVSSIFAELIDKKKLQEIKQKVGCFSIYSRGISTNAISYTLPDCNYIVPNVQAMAVGLHYAGFKCLKWLEKNIYEDNWRYGFKNENHFINRTEDIPHLGFICMALNGKEAAKKVIQTAEVTMNKMYESNVCKSQIGNLDAVFSLATSNEKLKKIALMKTHKVLCDEGENFRARCWAAYALAKAFTDGFYDKNCILQ